MSTSTGEIRITVRASDPKQQTVIQNILQDLKRTSEFSSISTEIKVQQSKFTPEEVFLMIVIGFASQISADLVLAFLRKIWARFQVEKIMPDVKDLNQVQKRAEKYIKELGIHRFDITEIEDYGLCVQFRFQDSKKRVHSLLVSKTDLAVLRYLRQEDS
jgi:hypothetical protein